MSQDVKFCLGISLVIITVMGLLGLVIDGTRAVIYGVSDNWRELFVFTLSMMSRGGGDCHYERTEIYSE